MYSAIANAKSDYSLKKEDLKIKKIEAQEGPTLDRWAPRAFGRAAPIRKRSTHLLIILEPQKGASVIKKTDSLKPKKVQKIVSREDLKGQGDAEVDKPKREDESKKLGTETSRGPRPKTGGGSFIKKVLRRKTI